MILTGIILTGIICFITGGIVGACFMRWLIVIGLKEKAKETPLLKTAFKQAIRNHYLLLKKGGRK